MWQKCISSKPLRQLCSQWLQIKTSFPTQRNSFQSSSSHQLTLTQSQASQLKLWCRRLSLIPKISTYRHSSTKWSLATSICSSMRTTRILSVRRLSMSKSIWWHIWWNSLRQSYKSHSTWNLWTIVYMNSSMSRNSKARAFVSFETCFTRPSQWMTKRCSIWRILLREYEHLSNSNNRSTFGRSPSRWAIFY